MNPIDLTPEEENELLVRYRFKEGNMDGEIRQAMGILNRGADDLEDLAAAFLDALPESYTPPVDEARRAAVTLETLAARLSAIAASMLRQAGRLEGMAEVIAATERADEMLAAHRRGEFGPYQAQQDAATAKAEGAVQP